MNETPMCQSDECQMGGGAHRLTECCPGGEHLGMILTYPEQVKALPASPYTGSLAFDDVLPLAKQWQADREKLEQEAIRLAGERTFILGKDIPETIERSRAVLVQKVRDLEAEREAKDAEIQRLTEQRDDLVNELKSIDVAATGEGMLFAPKFTRRCQKVLKLAQRCKSAEAERDTLRARVTALEQERDTWKANSEAERSQKFKRHRELVERITALEAENARLKEAVTEDGKS